jgi:long-chain acyl-CoA synthetase
VASYQVADSRPWFRHWPKNVPTHVEYPERTLESLLEERARTHPDDVQFIFYDRKITFRETNEYANRFASALHRLGAKKGTGVAIMLPACPQFAFAFYGVLRVGGIVIPVNPLYTEFELKTILNDSGAEIVLVLDSFYSVLKRSIPGSKVRRVIYTNISDFMPPLKAALGKLLKKVPVSREPEKDGIESFLELLKGPSEPLPVQIEVKKDPAVLMYTGGTTGIPKAAVLTNYNLVSNCVMIQKWVNLTEDDCMLSVLPWFHVYGMTVLLNSSVMAGVKLIVLPRFSVHDTLQAVRKHNPTSFPGVFSMYIALLRSPLFDKYKQYFRRMRASVSGAAPLPAEVAKDWKESTGSIIVEGYGLSEASPVTHVNPVDDPSHVKVGSIGIPLPDTDAKVVDIETGTKELKPGEVGELVIRGPQVAQGYWKRDEETAQTFRDGWLYTGDIAYMDEDGYFFIVDRKKDMINVSGMKVYPREVEEVAYQNRAVKLAAVIGVPDSFHGEVPKLFVVLKDEYKGKVRPEEIVEFMNGKLAPYKVPKSVEIREEIPTTMVGKVLRRKLREGQSA